VHGTEDDVIPSAVTEVYAEAARAAGDEVAALMLEEDGHFEPVDPLAASWPRVEAAIVAALNR
jgi:hypothetical protein